MMSSSLLNIYYSWVLVRSQDYNPPLVKRLNADHESMCQVLLASVTLDNIEI